MSICSERQKKIDDGMAVERLLQDELVQNALKSMRDRYIKALLATDTNSRDVREEMYLLHTTLDTFVCELGKIVENGKVESSIAEHDSRGEQ